MTFEMCSAGRRRGQRVAIVLQAALSGGSSHILSQSTAAHSTSADGARIHRPSSLPAARSGDAAETPAEMPASRKETPAARRGDAAARRGMRATLIKTALQHWRERPSSREADSAGDEPVRASRAGSDAAGGDRGQGGAERAAAWAAAMPAHRGHLRGAFLLAAILQWRTTVSSANPGGKKKPRASSGHGAAPPAVVTPRWARSNESFGREPCAVYLCIYLYGSNMYVYIYTHDSHTHTHTLTHSPTPRIDTQPCAEAQVFDSRHPLVALFSMWHYIFRIFCRKTPCCPRWG